LNLLTYYPRQRSPAGLRRCEIGHIQAICWTGYCPNQRQSYDDLGYAIRSIHAGAPAAGGPGARLFPPALPRRGRGPAASFCPGGWRRKIARAKLAPSRRPAGIQCRRRGKFGGLRRFSLSTRPITAP
jgi:hypothetical protein